MSANLIALRMPEDWGRGKGLLGELQDTAVFTAHYTLWSSLQSSSSSTPNLSPWRHNSPTGASSCRTRHRRHTKPNRAFLSGHRLLMPTARNSDTLDILSSKIPIVLPRLHDEHHGHNNNPHIMCQPEMDCRFVTKHIVRSIRRHTKLCICLSSCTTEIAYKSSLLGHYSKL